MERPAIERSVAHKQVSLEVALWASVAAGVLLTVVAFLLDPARLFATNPSLHVALNVSEGLIAILIAYLLVGRVRSQGRSSDAVAVFALSLLAFNNLVVSALPTATGGTIGERVLAWAPYLIRLIAHAGFAIAAVSRARILRRPEVAVTSAVLAAFLTVLVSAMAATILSSLVPSAKIIRGPAVGSFLDPSHPLTTMFQIASAGLLAIAAFGFAKKARSFGDDLYMWFGLGAVIGTFSRLQYALFPGSLPDEVYLADALRLTFYLLMLIGAQREIRTYWQARAIASALDERRRVARDLHDGLAQELVFIAGLANRVQRGAEDPATAAPKLVSSADRALGEARRAISILTTDEQSPLYDALEKMVEELQVRTHVPLEFVGERSVDLAPREREEVLRTAREAVINAIKHADATRVVVRLEGTPAPFVEVSDDGIGFDTAAPPQSAGGFGLLSMTERATALGVRLSIRSSPDKGTTVRLELPSTTS